MPHGIDPRVQAVQAAKPKPVLDRVFAEPTLDQLRPRNHPMLSSRELRHYRISRSPSTSQPAYIAG